MTLRATLKNLAVSETGFVFDPHSGATFMLNASGQAVLKVLREGGTPEEAADTLRSGYDGTPADVRDHVVEFVSLLRRHGLAHDETSTDGGSR